MAAASSPQLNRPKVPRKRALYESRREREFYRYYEPIRALTDSGPPLCNLNDEAAVKAHRPFGSPDPALTAFCQLGALRLGTRRAMLFFFDSNYAYVLAEATRTLSLKDDSVHEIEDKLWLGHVIIPRGFSICEETVCRLPSAEESLDGQHNLIHIINDLERDTKFCDRPYVTDGPKARFYAGVPITTPKGINIGAYCLLDDKEHPTGLDDKAILFLRDMASTVMKHLEACRAKAEHQRGTRMVTGLGAFIEGASDMRAWEEEYKRRENRHGGRTPAASLSPIRQSRSPNTIAKVQEGSPLTLRQRKDSEHLSKKLDSNYQSDDSLRPYSDAVETQDELEEPKQNGVTPKMLKPKRVEQSLQEPKSAEAKLVDSVGAEIKSAMLGATEHTNAETKVIEARSTDVNTMHPTDGPLKADARPGDHDPKSGKPTRQGEDFQAQLVADNVRNTFQRAADLVREAVDVEGSVFLDASVGTFGGLVEAGDVSEASDNLTGAEYTEHESESGKIAHGKGLPDKVCKVLASSHNATDQYHTRGQLQTAAEKINITEKFLKSVLRRYGHGKIWNFNEEGDASSDDESSETSSKSVAKKGSSQNGTATGESKNIRRQRRAQNKIDDGREIQRLFPGVRSLALVGMWDQSRGRWFSACAVWTYSPLRLFSPESEVSYISAFCDVLMAEVHRIEAQNSDRAKSDFISSISHELRSPLHGILGSAECLQEQPTDSFSAGLVSQIEICGRTLLDIVDHLLDFSKVNHLARTRMPLGDVTARKRVFSRTGRMGRLAGIMSMDAEVVLDEVTEEVVEAAVYSFCCSRDKQAILGRKVAVILDIDRSFETSWRCMVPLGGWKRICINLVSNALKYTAEGYVHCTLRAEPIPGKRRRFNVIFEVKDTGRGISKEFLREKLFSAFSQEDTLVEGTGLGMSLVAKIVKGMGGKIEVQSEKGVGTTMLVTVPMERSRLNVDGTTDSPHLHPQPHPPPFEGLSAGIIDFGDGGQDTTGDGRSTHELAKALATTSMQQHCEHLGLKTHLTHNGSIPEADVYFVSEDDLDAYRARLQRDFKPAGRLIVHCATAISARQLRSRRVAEQLGGCVEFIAQPCSTTRLTMAIKQCLQMPYPADPALPKYISHTIAGAAQNNDSTDSLETVRPPELQHLASARSHPKQPSYDTLDEGPISFVPRVAKPRRPDISGRSRLEQDYDPLDSRSKSLGERPQSPFPLDPYSAKKAGKTPPQSPPVITPTNHPRGLHLLLVDDNQINLQLLVNYATKKGHRRLTAMNGQQAVDAYIAATTSRPEVILMDINMPVLNGFEATRLIRAWEQQNNIVPPAHIIALTGLGSASAQQEAFSSGVDLFLTKPVRLKELTKLLDGIRTEAAAAAGVTVGAGAGLGIISGA